MPPAQAPEDPLSIVVSNATVRYRMHAFGQPTLGEYLDGLLHRRRRRSGVRTFDALRNVSLQVREGEIVGVIGRNGAGKSTLLKAIAGVLRPMSGAVEVRGRIVPLLELGTGFNANLTGRENIYLTGSLFGLSRRELAARIDDIIQFSELEDFIDVPIKSYSSGTVARLAFSLATDVDPDVLLIDEVFSVGDEFFQRKSMARMRRLFDESRTIMLVSHSLDLIRFQCTRVIWLEAGSIVRDGEPGAVIDAYRASG